MTELQCHGCGKKYRPEEIDYVCPEHAGNNRLEVLYDYEAIKNRFAKADLAVNPDTTIKRYAPILPASREVLETIPYHVGGTPLIKATTLSKELGMDNVFVKFDASNPSASLKDRASFMVTALAKARGRKAIAAASSGNAACSLAAVCAAADMRAILFVPEAIPKAKLMQIAIYGAEVFVVQGSYDEAFSLCEKACEEFGWYSRNTGFNPYTREGKKTVAFEIAEQLGWNVPDWVIVPVGDGCIISGVHKGFLDLYRLGWIEKIPRIVAVQAQGASSLYESWKRGDKEPSYMEATSSVDSINVGLPGDGGFALKAIKDTDGLALLMSDEEMRQSMLEMSRKQGLMGCVAGSSAWGALKILNQKKMIKSDETVILLNTGHGLKDIAHFENHTFTSIHTIKPNINDLKQYAA
ncbi:MAG: threonine synthase [Rhodospirillales bacterium]|nr:threonine synthase [Rhodospirillales bacterium]